jgi:hypothetical protein
MFTFSFGNNFFLLSSEYFHSELQSDTQVTRLYGRSEIKFSYLHFKEYMYFGHNEKRHK